MDKDTCELVYREGCAGCKDAYQRIAELEDQLRWRSVDMELPEKNGEYFVRDIKGQHYRDWWCFIDWEVRELNPERDIYTHWLPIPKLTQEVAE